MASATKEIAPYALILLKRFAARPREERFFIAKGGGENYAVPGEEVRLEVAGPAGSGRYRELHRARPRQGWPRCSGACEGGTVRLVA